MQSELQPLGRDRELWVVRHLKWAFPVYCDLYSESGDVVTHYVIRPALSLLQAPMLALKKFLKPHDLATANKNFWVIRASDWGTLASKAPGVTPAFYYQWEGGHEGDPALNHIEIMDDERPGHDFLRFLSGRSTLEYRMLKLVWCEMQAAMIEWLVQVQKPIRMDFCTIRALPYRVNWKEILLSWHPYCAAFFFRKDRRKLEDTLIETGFMADLGRTELAAMEGNRKFFRWTLECSANHQWDAAVEDAESVKLGTKGPPNYTLYYERCLKNHLPEVIEAYTRWLREMAFPVGAVGTSAVSGKPILLPRSKIGRVLPKGGRAGATYFMVGDGGLHIAEEKANKLEKQAERLLAVPRVQQQVSDMRESEDTGLLEPTGDRGASDDRMPLLVSEKSDGA